MKHKEEHLQQHHILTPSRSILETLVDYNINLSIQTSMMLRYHDHNLLIVQLKREYNMHRISSLHIKQYVWPSSPPPGFFFLDGLVRNRSETPCSAAQTMTSRFSLNHSYIKIDHILENPIHQGVKENICRPSKSICCSFSTPFFQS